MARAALLHFLRSQSSSFHSVARKIPAPKTIKFTDIRPADTYRPFVSFKANDKFYFVNSEHCHNKALLAKLTPESAFKNV